MRLTIFVLIASIFTLVLLIWLAVTNNFYMVKCHGAFLQVTYAIIVIVIVYESFI